MLLPRLALNLEHLTTSVLNVVPKDLPELEPPHSIEALHDKLHGRVGGNCSAVAGTAASGLLLPVVEVGSHKKVARDEGRDVAIVLFVHHDGNALAVVGDRDVIGLNVDGHLKAVNVGIALRVVGHVD